MSKKSELHKKLLQSITQKIDTLQKEIDAMNDSLNTATKSSAGDKHETSRAMIQLEQERVGKQLSKIVHMRDLANTISPDETHDSNKLGSLVKTANGEFYISVAMGMIDSVFCMSPTTPLAQVLLGKKKGESTQFNGKSIEILELI